MKTLITSLAVIILALILTPQTINAQCHIDDWTALKALYDGANGDNWIDRTGWDIHIAPHNSYPGNCNLDDLFGVTLSGSRVSELNLGANNLTGYISYKIGDLTNLKALYLNNNLFNNLVTPHIGDLNNLEVLHLHQNEFNGPIPASFGKLSNLNELLLHDNRFSGSLDAVLGNLTNLNVLKLNNNELEGCYSNNLNTFCSLATNADVSNGNNFDASWESFCNTGTSGLCSGCNIDDWNALKALYESTDGDNWTIRTGWATQIDGLNSPPTNCNLEELYGVFLGYDDRVKYLNLENNNLYGLIPSGIGDLEKAIQLNLSNNQLVGNIPKEIGHIGYIELLWLNNNQLTGIIPEELATSYNLKNLRLENNFLNGTIPYNFGGINNINNLSLHNNLLSGCYYNNLATKCDIATNAQISNGNSFNTSWEDFCNTGSGTCEPCSVDYCSANIDLNFDFIPLYPPGLGGGGGFCAGTGLELRSIVEPGCVDFIDWTITTNGTSTSNLTTNANNFYIDLPVSNNQDQTLEVCATINYSNGTSCSTVCETLDLFCAPFVPEANVTVGTDFIRVLENNYNGGYYVVSGLTQNYIITGEDEFGNTVQTFNTSSNQDAQIFFPFDFNIRAIRIQHLNNSNLRFRNWFK